MSQTGDTWSARDHARAQGDSQVDTMPTMPPSAAQGIPEGVDPDRVIWDEVVGAGNYTSVVVPRGARIRILDLSGDTCVQLLLHHAERPIERLNVADTVKVQWQAYLGEGSLLLSDMGRAMASIIDDTSGHHDAFCGMSNRRHNERRYGAGEVHGPTPNARDRFAVALAKHGLGRVDIAPNLNLFKGVRVLGDGELVWIDGVGRPSQVVLRAEMPLLVSLAVTPHVLDPREKYDVGSVRLSAWADAGAPPDDPIRNATPESIRAFENTEVLQGHRPAGVST